MACQEQSMILHFGYSWRQMGAIIQYNHKCWRSTEAAWKDKIQEYHCFAAQVWRLWWAQGCWGVWPDNETLALFLSIYSWRYFIVDLRCFLIWGIPKIDWFRMENLINIRMMTRGSLMTMETPIWGLDTALAESYLLVIRHGTGNPLKWRCH